jgi:nucleotidyltransferase/DNA polymerase involved in DNA repair
VLWVEKAKCPGEYSHTVYVSDWLSVPVRPQTILRQAAVPAFLNPLPFTKIRFLGGKLGGAMASEYGAGTVGDML